MLTQVPPPPPSTYTDKRTFTSSWTKIPGSRRSSVGAKSIESCFRRKCLGWAKSVWEKYRGALSVGFYCRRQFFRQNFRRYANNQVNVLMIISEWPETKCYHLKWSTFHMCTLYAIPRKKSKIGRLLKFSMIVQILLAVMTYCCFGRGGTWSAIACAVIAFLTHCFFLMTSRNFQRVGMVRGDCACHFAMPSFDRIVSLWQVIDGAVLLVE